jgi:hypothetical protein
MQMRGLNPNGTPNAAYPVLLDVDNLIDYMLVVFFDGSFDSPMSTFLNNASNNWFGVRDRAGARVSVYVHDHEHGMESVGDGRPYNRTGPWGGSGVNEWGRRNTTVARIRSTFYSKSNPHLHEMLAYSAEHRSASPTRAAALFHQWRAVHDQGARTAQHARRGSRYVRSRRGRSLGFIDAEPKLVAECEEHRHRVH